MRATFASTTTAFLPVFFQRFFPEMKSTYAYLNAITMIVCGFSSSIIGGIISDKYEKKSYMTKSWVIILGNLIGIPFFSLMCLCSNFWLAITCNCFQLLF